LKEFFGYCSYHNARTNFLLFSILEMLLTGSDCFHVISDCFYSFVSFRKEFLWTKFIAVERVMDTTKTDFFFIYWFVHTYWFLHVIIHVCSWSSLTRYIENAAARSWSWSKCGDRGGVVIWWKICWHVFLRGHLWENFVWKSHPFPSERNRPGREEVIWTCVENISPANHIDCISLVHGNIMYCVAGPRRTVTLIISKLKWLPRLTWGEKCSKIP